MPNPSLIRDQFTFQAAAYAKAPTINNEEILQRGVAACDPQPNDDVLDVACGPGILTCALAQKVKHATGIDLTPAMLEQARQLQAEKQLTNMTWMEGDVTHLPFADGSFTLVTCRYAFHHFVDPLIVLKEMKRVCREKIVVIDTAPALAKAAAFNRMEKLRDPSHARALAVEEMAELFVAADLPKPQVEQMRMAGDLNSLLKRSQCHPGDDVRCRELFDASLSDDAIDMRARREGDNFFYEFPVAIYSCSTGG